MFRNFIIIVVLVFVSTILVPKNLYSVDCPPGYNSGVINNMLVLLENGDGCYGNVYYCWKDNANGERIIHITAIHFFNKHCLAGATVSKYEFWENIYRYILSYQSSLPISDPEFLPINGCDNWTTVSHLYYETCWKWDISIGLPSGPLEGGIGLVRCIGESELCIKKYNVCYNYLVTPPLIQISLPILIQGASTLCNEALPFDPYNIQTVCFTIECVPGE